MLRKFWYVLLLAFTIILTGNSSVTAATHLNPYNTWYAADSKNVRQPLHKIPNEYHGTFYTWNTLQKRVERVQITDRSFIYSYQQTNGQYQTLQKFAGKALIVNRQGGGQIGVRALKHKSQKGITYSYEHTVIRQAGDNLQITFQPFGAGELSANQHVTFTPRLISKDPPAQPLTLSWLRGKNFRFAFDIKQQIQRVMIIGSNGSVKFDDGGATNGVVSEAYNDLEKSDTGRVVAVVPTAANGSYNLIFHFRDDGDGSDYLINGYWAVSCRRIDTEFCDFSAGTGTSYHGHRVHAITALTGRWVSGSAKVNLHRPAKAHQTAGHESIAYYSRFHFPQMKPNQGVLIGWGVLGVLILGLIFWPHKNN